MDAVRSSIVIGSGDGQADADRRAELDTLFRAEGPTLLGFLRRHTHYPEDAADLLQETFARFAQGPALEQIDNPAAYLQRIARNLLINRRRMAEHRAAHLPLDETQLVAPSPSPHEQLEAREALERLDACLARLRPKTREVFLLHRVDSLTYPQIAARLGVSVSAVEKHMMKAIAHLDRRLNRR